GLDAFQGVHPALAVGMLAEVSGKLINAEAAFGLVASVAALAVALEEGPDVRGELIDGGARRGGGAAGGQAHEHQQEWSGGRGAGESKSIAAGHEVRQRCGL